MRFQMQSRHVTELQASIEIEREELQVKRAPPEGCA
jgi:hypothetical protein